MKRFTKQIIRYYMYTWRGERCPDFHPQCPLCQAWKAHDLLMDIDETPSN